MESHSESRRLIYGPEKVEVNDYAIITCCRFDIFAPKSQQKHLQTKLYSKGLLVKMSSNYKQDFSILVFTMVILMVFLDGKHIGQLEIFNTNSASK